jgi:anti-sigma28 factor (negative regulator of flagellin synthesis)
MKVDHMSISTSITTAAGKAAEPGAAGETARAREGARSVGSSDSVQFSHVADQLLRQTETPRQVDRIARLTQEYRSGRYAIDTRQVSRAVVAESISYAKLEANRRG